MTKKIAAASLALALSALPAWAGSTINPNTPAVNAPLNSAPVRGNFAAAYNDVNNLLAGFQGTIAPGSPTVFQDWLDTSTTPATWRKRYSSGWGAIGTFNLSTGVFTLGTFTSTQSANVIFAGPSSGSPAAPGFRAMVAADLPASVPLKTAANIFTQPQTVSLNSGSLPAALTGTVLRLASADAAATRIELSAFGAQGFFSSVGYGGTAASPTAITSGTQIGGYNAHAYNGASVVGPIATFRIFAAENIASGHQGSYAEACTTPNASTTLACVMRWENDGGVTVPFGVTGGSKGAGTLNASGLYDTGNRVLSSASSIPLTQLAPQADQTVVGNVSGGSAVPIALTKTQLTTLVNAFTATLNGAVPNPGSSTGKFLRDDATWQTAAGTGTVTSAVIAQGNGILVTGTCTITITGTCTVADDIGTNTNLWSATANKIVDAAHLNSAGNLVALTDGASIAVDMSTGINFSLLFTTHGGSRTLSNPTNTQAGRTGCMWITQDATGGEGLTLGTSWMTPSSGGIALSSGANQTDLVCYAVQDATHASINVVQLNTVH